MMLAGWRASSFCTTSGQGRASGDGPNRDVLLLTGRGHRRQAMMLAVAEQALQDGRSISGVPLVLDAGGGGGGRTSDHPLAAVFHRVEFLTCGCVQPSEGTARATVRARRSRHLRSSFSAMENEGVVSSYCVWTRGPTRCYPELILSRS